MWIRLFLHGFIRIEKKKKSLGRIFPYFRFALVLRWRCLAHPGVLSSFTPYSIMVQRRSVPVIV